MAKLEKFVFNHEEDDFEEAIGVTEEIVRETVSKVQDIVTEVQNDEEGCQSMIVESLMDNCNKEELCLMLFLLISGRVGAKRHIRVKGGDIPDEVKEFLEGITKGELNFDDIRGSSSSDTSKSDTSKDAALKKALRNFLNDGL